jgi:hypothetical protein
VKYRGLEVSTRRGPAAALCALLCENSRNIAAAIAQAKNNNPIEMMICFINQCIKRTNALRRSVIGRDELTSPIPISCSPSLARRGTAWRRSCSSAGCVWPAITGPLSRGDLPSPPGALGAPLARRQPPSLRRHDAHLGEAVGVPARQALRGGAAALDGWGPPYLGAERRPAIVGCHVKVFLRYRQRQVSSAQHVGSRCWSLGCNPRAGPPQTSRYA